MSVRHNEVKVAGRLPQDDAINGLPSIHHRLVNAGPDDTFVIVAWCDVLNVTTGWDSDGSPVQTPTLRIRRTEPIVGDGDAATALKTAVMNAAEQRLGSPPLPFDQVDPDAGRDLDDDEFGDDE